MRVWNTTCSSTFPRSWRNASSSPDSRASRASKALRAGVARATRESGGHPMGNQRAACQSLRPDLSAARQAGQPNHVPAPRGLGRARQAARPRSRRRQARAARSQPPPGLTSHISKQPGQSAEFLGQARISGIVNHPVRNPHLVQRGQLRMASRREHGADRPLDWADSAHSCE